jgi:DNA-binding IscR family transcriptional regulator
MNESFNGIPEDDSDFFSDIKAFGQEIDDQTKKGEEEHQLVQDLFENVLQHYGETVDSITITEMVKILREFLEAIL